MSIRSIKQHSLIVILIFGFSFLLLIYSTQQINLTYDSKEYINAAQSLKSSGELLTRDGQSFSNWAPLFPLILSTFGGDLGIYKYFNLLIFLLLELGMILLILNLIQDKLLQIICSIWLAFSTPILMQFNFLWSEPLFITFLIFKILFFLKFQKTTKKGYYFAMIALGMLLCLQRYAGLFIVPAFALMLISSKKINRHSILRGLLYGMVSVLPLLIWIGLNYQQKGDGFSVFASNLFVRFIPNLFRSYYQDIFFSWFLPNKLVFQLGLYYSFVFLILLIIVWWKTKFWFTKDQMLLITISLVYYLFLILIDYSYLNDKVKDFSYLSDFGRYLAVLYVPVLLLLFSIMDKKTVLVPVFHKRILFILLFIWSLYPIGRTIKNTIHWKNYSQQSTIIARSQVMLIIEPPMNVNNYRKKITDT